MNGAAHFIIGAPVVGSDGRCGHVRGAIIDPETRTLTYLAVEPARSRPGGRLVPIDLVKAVNNEVQVRCSHIEFVSLPVAGVTEFVGPGDKRLPYQDGSQIPLEMGTQRGLGYAGVYEVVREETSEIVPTAEVQAHRNDPIYASDGPIGAVQGFSVALEDHKLTHVLVSAGLLWGRKLVAVPIDAVTGIEGGIAVRLTRQQVKDLPVTDVLRA